MASNNLSSTLVGGLGGGVSDGESSSTGTAGGGFGLHPNLLERQGSIQGRERMIAHSTALESITAEVDSMTIGNAPYNTTTGNTAMPGNVTSQGLPYFQDDESHDELDDSNAADDATDSGINNVW